MSSHQDWEEAAAGHALGALEPNEEQQFETHLAGCDQCRRVLADTDAVMAELASELAPVAPPPALKARILAAIAGETDDRSVAAVSSPDTLEVVRARRRAVTDMASASWLRLAAAAVVVLLAVIAGGVWSLHGSDGGQPRFVALQSTAAGGAAPGTVEVIGRRAWVIPSGLATNDRATTQYVLWALPDNGAPQAIGGFDVGAGPPAVPVGHVGESLSSVKAFAVSREAGRTLPGRPSVIVAQGQLD